MVPCPVCTGARYLNGGPCGACNVSGQVTAERAAEITAQQATARQVMADIEAALAARAAQVQADADAEQARLAEQARQRNRDAAAAAAAARARQVPAAVAAAAAERAEQDRRTAAGILDDPPAEQYGQGVRSAIAGFPNGTTAWLNVITFGADPFGIYDSTRPIQAALNIGGTVYLPAGLYIITQSLQIGSGTVLLGDGIGLTTVRAAAGFSPARVGTNTGAVMLTTTGNTAQNHIGIRGITFDGNQATITSIPAYADGPECAPVSLWNSTAITIDSIEVINAVGYSIYTQLCTRVLIAHCKVVSGAGSALGTNQQDAIHVTGCAQVRILGNDVDTGTGSAGDDGVAVQALGTACTDIAVTGNMIRAAQSGIHLAIGGAANISDIDVSGNDVWQVTGGDGFRADTSSSGAVSAVAVTGNTFRNLPQHGINIAVPFTGLQIAGNELDTATNGLANGISVSGGGKDLSITGNTFSNWGAATGITAGLSGAGITGFAIDANVLDMSAGTSAANGIAVIDSADGSVTGNIVLGSTQASSDGIKINGITVAPLGLAVNGNRVKGWANAIIEVNGGQQPDFNAYVGNNCHGCTAFITTSGTHDVVASNVVA